MKITSDLDRRWEDYNYYLDKISRIMTDDSRQIIAGTAARFAREASRFSPPKKAIGKRTIPRVLLRRPEAINLKKAADWEPRKTIHYFRIKRYRDKTPYGVKIHDKWHWTSDPKEFRDKQEICNRGVIRYGWLQALPVLGESVKPVVPPSWRFAFLAGKFLAQGKIGTTSVRDAGGYQVEVVNSARASKGPFPLQYAAARALSLVNLGLKHQIKRLEQHMEKVEVPF